MSAEGVDSAQPKVLLAGNSSARPAGLERALNEAGFQLVEREDNVENRMVAQSTCRSSVPASARALASAGRK